MTSEQAQQPEPDNGAALASGGGGRRGDFLAKESGAFVPANLAQAMEFARLLANSGMVPKGYEQNPGAVLVAVQMGAELGLSPMQAVQNIANINGRPSLWGDAILAVVMGHRDFVDCEEMDLDEIKEAGKAVCVVQRRGRKPTRATFSIDDAKTAKLWDKSGPWTQYPWRMLKMRARAFACRDAFPDALRGIHVAEEVHDVEAKVVEPVPSAAGAAGVSARVVAQAAALPAQSGASETLSDLDNALKQVQEAQDSKTLGELAVSDLVRGLSDKDKAEVRKAYRGRMSEIEQQPEPAPPAGGNGELSPEEEARMAAEQAAKNGGGQS